MSKHWKWTLAAVFTVALALSALPAIANTPETGRESNDPAPDLAIQHNLLLVSVDTEKQDGPVVTLSSDGVVAYESFVLDAPDRLVIDLTGVVNRVDNYRVDVGAGGLARIRAAQHRVEPVPVTRIVFDLEQPLEYRIEQSGRSLQIAFGTAADWSEPLEPTVAEVETPAAMPAESIGRIIDELEQRNAEHETPAVEEQPISVPEPALTDVEPFTVDLDPIEVTGQTAEQTTERVVEPIGRSVEPDVIERLLSAPAYAAPQDNSGSSGSGVLPSSFQTQTIVTAEVTYTGKRISLNLVDADLKQVFRLFHEISGLNFVLDPGVTGRVTIVLDQVPWDQALDIILRNNGLDKVLEDSVLRIASTTQLAQEAAARRQLRDAMELEVEPITLTRTLSYAKAREVQAVIREGGILSQRGRVIVDERTNTLIISDVPKKVEPLDALISTLDAETPQVMIEARIVETSRNFTQDLGVEWGFSAIADASRGTSTGLKFPHNASTRYGLNLPGDGGASNLAFSFSNIVDSFTLDVALNALETEGEGRILSAPRIATQNNERAEIEQGVRIPVVNTTATEISVEFVSASLRLIVTPQITAEGTIILDLEVENNSPDFFNTAGDIPSIRTQRAQTKVLISDGGTTVIGGIFTVNEAKSEIGVPWFRKLPVFGWLFRTNNITNENRELLIFITPKIMKLG